MKVFIGDPCYILSDSNYRSMLWGKNPDIMTNDMDIEGDTVVSNDCIIDGPLDEDDEVIHPLDNDELDYTEYGSEYPEGYQSVKVVDTWCGDGIFTDQDGNEYGVDSGQIGMVPESLWDKTSKNWDILDKLGLIVDVVNWDVFSRNGTIFCDDRVIMTGPGDDEGRVVYEDE